MNTIPEIHTNLCKIIARVTYENKSVRFESDCIPLETGVNMSQEEMKQNIINNTKIPEYTKKVFKEGIVEYIKITTDFLIKDENGEYYINIVRTSA